MIDGVYNLEVAPGGLDGRVGVPASAHHDVCTGLEKAQANAPAHAPGTPGHDDCLARHVDGTLHRQSYRPIKRATRSR